MGRFKQSFCLPCFLEGSGPKDFRAVVERAAGIGYPAFEIWFREDVPFDLVCDLARGHEMTLASMCGHRSLADGLNKKENHARIRDELLASIDLAEKNGIPNLICFSGNRYGKDDARCIGIVADGIALVTEAAEAAGVMLNIELLNSKVDHSGYQCDRSAWGIEVVRRVGSPNVKLLYDIYHMQIMEGDLCRTIKQGIQHIGHFHTAGNPGRQDMDETQEIYYPAVIRTIAETGYDRHVAHEFFPKGNKLEALEKAFHLFAAA